MSRLPAEIEIELLQSRIAAAVVSRLGQRAAELPHDVTERLRFAREQAVARARAARRETAPAAMVGVAGGVAVAGGSSSRWWRWTAVVPALALAAGLVLVEYWNYREQVLAAADIDAVLLADDLPPDAYADPGFVEFLKSPPGDES